MYTASGIILAYQGNTPIVVPLGTISDIYVLIMTTYLSLAILFAITRWQANITDINLSRK